MKVLALDIGASSGRFIVVDYDKGSFNSTETYRFLNGMSEKNGHLIWDLNSIISNIKKGLRLSLGQFPDIKCLGVDTWAVDYVLLKDGKAIADPIGYRDNRNVLSSQKLLEKADYQDIYKESGIQFLNFNSIFQLYDDISSGKDFDSFLMIPDYINYFLTGKSFIELTNLSTTALYNPLSRKLSKKNIDLIGLDEKKIPALIYPCQKVGKIRDDLAEELGIPALEIVSVGSHDTASCVASVGLNEKSAYLSSGTWSLLGIEEKLPIINCQSYESNFTNEIGLDHTVRFLKNIMGLFIIQELRKDFLKTDAKVSFQILQDEALSIKENDIYIDVADALFQQPGNMLEKYYSYLKKTGQYHDDITRGQIVLSVYESMAFKYVGQFNNLKAISGRDLDTIVVIGGGINAKILNQLIADCVNVKVVTGQSEATVMGNCLAQFLYLGEFSSLKEAREALLANTVKETYLPINKDKYSSKYQKYLSVIGEKSKS